MVTAGSVVGKVVKLGENVTLQVNGPTELQRNAVTALPQRLHQANLWSPQTGGASPHHTPASQRKPNTLPQLPRISPPMNRYPRGNTSS